MPSSSAVKEYLYKLTPSIDTQKWNKATSFLNEKINKSQVDYNKTLEAQKDLQKSLLDLEEKRSNLISIKDKLLKKQEEVGGQGKDKAIDDLLESTTKSLGETEDSIAKTNVQIDLLGDDLENASGGFSKFTYNLINASNAVPTLFGLLRTSIEQTVKILDKGSEIGNKFITSNSMFVDEDVKGKMARYGVGSKQAQSILAAQKQLGISDSDYATMTSGQRKAFDELMKHYQEGLDSIDTDKLDAFNEATQKYQMSIAKFNMDLELAFTKLFAESKSLPKLVDTFTDFLEGVTDILSSDAAQFAFDTFLEFLNTIIKILGAPLKLLNGLFGGGNTTNNNTTNNTTNNYYNSASITSKPLSLQKKKKKI